MKAESVRDLKLIEARPNLTGGTLSVTEEKSLNPQEKKTSNTRVVEAPPPTDSSILPSIYSIELRDDQEVEWQWTQLPDNNRVVTGYKLIYRKAR